mmetsp:Transcript_127862/g.368235  ORF Transcript_127862/g.368235 Transcript_127862/m.368235 type:complete len:460 (-) Transcript_127862:30-1409(-)
MPKQGKKRKKRRTHKVEAISEKELLKTPRCFVVKRGAVGDQVKKLLQDFREVMSPNCAKNLRESRMNRIEDYLAVAGPLHVSHLVIFTSTKTSTYMKLAKLPQGPTLTFKVDSYSLGSDIRAAQKRPRLGARDFTVAPLQVLNGFGGGVAPKVERPAPKPLVSEMLRGLFPAVDVPNFNQAECRRTALFHHDPATDHVYFRHYTVTKKQFGLDRGVSKLLRTARLPKLGHREDIADFVLGGGGAASDSEVEATHEAPGANGGKVGVRLTELGPRMKLLLVKAEEGVCNGGVLYHRFMTKTPSQQQVLEQKARQRKKLQERNAKLEKAAGLAKENRAKRKKQAEKAAEVAERANAAVADEGIASSSDDGADGGKTRKTRGAGGGVGDKKDSKRFNPLYNKKARTVEFGDTGPSEGRGKGALQKQSRGGKGAQKGGGRASGKGQQRILDRFHQVQTRQRTV